MSLGMDCGRGGEEKDVPVRQGGPREEMGSGRGCGLGKRHSHLQ